MRIFSAFVILFSIHAVQAAVIQRPSAERFVAAKGMVESRLNVTTEGQVICIDQDGRDVTLVAGIFRGNPEFRAIFNLGRFGYLPASSASEKTFRNKNGKALIYQANLERTDVEVSFDNPIVRGSAAPVNATLVYSNGTKRMSCFAN